MSTDDERSWLLAHIAELRSRIATLTTGERKGAKGAQDSAAAERLERRVTRLLRTAITIEREGKAEAAKARRLGRSKAPADRAELILGALDELPIDLALDVVREAQRRVTSRAGGEAEVQ